MATISGRSDAGIVIRAVGFIDWLGLRLAIVQEPRKGEDNDTRQSGQPDDELTARRNNEEK